MLEWREDVVAPAGQSMHTLRPQLFKSPKVWWPLHLGNQARRCIHLLVICGQYEFVISLRKQEFAGMLWLCSSCLIASF